MQLQKTLRRIIREEIDKLLKESSLTPERAIKIQAQQLAVWKKLLQPKIYKALEAWATEYNSEAIDGQQIIRGTDMDNFIANYFNNYTPPNKK